jgi:diaminopimelate decarboxylase
MSAADLVAAHGSPLWQINLGILRDRWRTVRATWGAVWPDVELAYSHKANRHPAIVSALAAEGAGHQVSSEYEYRLARRHGSSNRQAIIVQGAAQTDGLLHMAASDGALVVADSARELDKAAAAGVKRSGLRVTQHGVARGPSVFGVPLADVSAIVRQQRARGGDLEVLAMHFLSSGFQRPPAEVRGMVDELVLSWPRPSEEFASSARALAALALRLGIPAVDLGGGVPPSPDERVYSRAIAGALGAAGFEGRLLIEPGRSVVGEAVDLACTVLGEKRLQDGTRCLIVDAGVETVAGALFRWPHIDAPGVDGETSPAMVVGPGSRYQDILHPAASLPPVSEGDVLVVRRVGAYNQSESTEHAAGQASVAIRDGDTWYAWPDYARERALDGVAATS